MWYQAALSSIGDAVLVTNREGRVEFMNPVAQTVTGWNEEAIGKDLPEVFCLVDELTHQAIENPISKVMREGTAGEVADHAILIKKDGAHVHVEASGAQIRDQEGNIDGVVLVLRDITKRKHSEQLIQDTIAYAESIIETVREPLVVLGQDLRVKTASRAFYQAFKVKPAETENQLLYNLGNGQWDIPQLRTLLEEILPQNNQFNDFEVEHTFEDIGPRIMLLNARRIPQQGNQSELILLAIEDITARKEIEAGLEKTRKELEAIKKSADEALEYAESIVNTVREPLISLNQDLRVVTASRSFYEVFKVNHEETVGQLIYDLGNKQWDIPKLRELLEDILPQKATFDDYEVEHDFSTIGRRIMLLNARQIQRGSGKERIILLAIEDITERKEIEAGLEKTRKELEVIKTSADEALEYAESIVNTVREPLISLDQDLRVVTASRSFYEVFKVNHAETVGQLIYDLGNKQWDIPKLRELLEDILPQKAAFDNYEVEHDFSTIGRRIMLLNARQIQRGLGKERIILLAIEDITERKQVENAMHAAKQAVEAASRAKSEFLANMSHELRTPLNSIIGFSEVLHDQTFGPLNPKQARYVDNVLTAGQHLLSLINDILDLSKVEAGKMTVEARSFAVRPMLDNALMLVKESALKRGLTIRLEALADLTVSADERMLKQILFNLLSNAVKFTEPGGRIAIIAERAGDDLCVSVADTGIGIKLEDQARLFKEFEQLDSGYDRNHQGTGLGLALTRKFVELHGGRIWVESAGEGKGSTFRFTLPLIREDCKVPTDAEVKR